MRFPRPDSCRKPYASSSEGYLRRRRSNPTGRRLHLPLAQRETVEAKPPARPGVLLHLNEHDDQGVSATMGYLKKRLVGVVTVGRSLQTLANKVHVNAYCPTTRADPLQATSTRARVSTDAVRPSVPSSYGAAHAADVPGVHRAGTVQVNL